MVQQTALLVLVLAASFHSSYSTQEDGLFRDKKMFKHPLPIRRISRFFPAIEPAARSSRIRNIPPLRRIEQNQEVSKSIADYSLPPLQAFPASRLSQDEPRVSSLATQIDEVEDEQLVTASEMLKLLLQRANYNGAQAQPMKNVKYGFF